MVLTVQGLEGPRVIDKVRVPILQIGDLRLVDRPAYCYHAGSGQLEPLLGLDVLTGYRILLDFQAKKMYLKTSIGRAFVEKN